MFTNREQKFKGNTIVTFASGILLTVAALALMAEECLFLVAAALLVSLI